MQIWNGMLWTTVTQTHLVLQQIFFMTSFCVFLFSQIKLVSKPLWRQNGKWHIVDTTTTQKTIAFFPIGRPLRSYKCHLEQRHYLIQYKVRAKTPQKKLYFFQLTHAAASFLCTQNSLSPSPAAFSAESQQWLHRLATTIAKVKNIVKLFELKLIYLKVMLTFIHPCQLKRHSHFYCFKVTFIFYALMFLFDSFAGKKNPHS